MQKRISNLPFHDTPEQAKQLEEVIEKLKGQQGAVMPALHQAQEIYGYLPMEVQKKIADGLDVSLEEVYNQGKAIRKSALSLSISNSRTDPSIFWKRRERALSFSKILRNSL